MATEQLEGFPLSPQQRRLWLLQNEERTFVARVAVSLEGPLRVELLQAAIGEVAGRHEILRTNFYRIAGAKFPVQVIAERPALYLEQLDLSTLGSLDREHALDAHLHDTTHLPAEAARETTVRAALLKLTEESHLLLLSVPALCADARSLANITREIGLRYGALQSGAEAGAGEPLQYADLAEALNELLESEETEAGRAYWRDKDFSGATGARLPLEQPGTREDFAPRALGVNLAAGTFARIAALTESRGVSPAAFLLACWGVLLWRLAARPEMACGVACDGRGYEELKEAVGLFTKHLPVRFTLADELPFGAVLEQASAAMREATERQEYFTWEQTGGGSERVTGGNAVPFLPQTFAYEATPASFTAGGIRFSVIRQYACVERFTIQLCCTRTTEELRADFHYDAHSFAQDDVRRLAGQYAKLLKSVLDEPEARIGELDILSDDERRQLLSVWNRNGGATTRAHEADGLHRLFEAQAERTPEAVAVIFSGEPTTYRELNRRANQLANYLIDLGVRAEARVGICLERSTEMIVALLGVMKAGGAYVPLDPESPLPRLAYQIENAGIGVLLTGADVQAHLPHFAGEVIRLERDRELLDAQPDTNPERVADPRQTAYVIYTSGSTGTPKGVAVTHGGLVNYATFIREQLLPHASVAGSQLHFATVSTISADLGNTSIFPSLISGGCLHVVGYEVATDGARFADYFSRHQVDVLKIVPSHLSALLAVEDGRAILPRKYLILGGEPFSFELQRRIAALNGTCVVINHYGPTETTIGSLVCEDTERAVAAASRWGAQTVPLGGPIANTEIYILNRSFQPVPVGVAGELHIGGAGLARGYLNGPAPTAERMIPHPFSAEKGARLYRTGDLARYLPDGQVEFLGRVDQQLKIRGFRIEPGEIESVLEAHPAVGQAVVTAREDTPGDKRLVAYVVPVDSSAPPPAELRHFLKQELPDHMIPSAFVVLKSLPLTANGKLDRAALPPPDEARPELEGGFVAARTHAETVLADIWAQVLGLKQVGIHDNFFELGGDSILSIQIAARANHANLRFTPIQLFQHPTIAGLAAVVGDEREAPHASGAADSIPLTPIQHHFFASDFPDAQHWNLSLLLEPGEALDPSLLEQALQELPRHHDALRLHFNQTPSGWRQTISGAGAGIPFTQVDLSALPAAEQTRALETQAAALQATLSLTEGVLLRAAYFDLGAARPGRLLLVVHHLLVDMTSWRILLDDLWTAYTQLARGERIELAPVPTPFKLWAERLADYARSSALRDEANYWLGATAGQPGPLPSDFPGGANTVASSRTLSLRLAEEETRVLLQDVPKANRAQVGEVLLTALALAFARWTAARSLHFDLEGHGREEIFDGLGLSRTLGWFTTIYPVRLNVEPGATPQDALSEVKGQVRGVPRGGIGYGLLRYAGADNTVAEQLRARPAPEASFNYWGNLDRVMSEAGAFALAPESAGANQSARAVRPHLLEVSGMITQGRLRMDWVYSENLHRPQTIERLAEDCMSALRSFIAHARSPEARRYTPADFPRVKLDQQKLDKILGGLNSPET
jgi:amino acid adenylation domain-containing protein/non-ribosomal peptide synthase protein (TIGR01720 family)